MKESRRGREGKVFEFIDLVESSRIVVLKLNMRVENIVSITPKAPTERGKEQKTNVVSTGDPQDVALELVSESIGRNLLGHTLLVEDATVFLNGLCLASGSS